MMLRCLFSRTVRQASDLITQVGKHVAAQRDQLDPKALEEISAASAALREQMRSGAGKKPLREGMRQLEQVAGARLKAYPHAEIREYVEMALVVITVVLAFRAFFFQPFTIPTGSMQPTLYGITHQDLRGRAEAKVPTGWERFVDRWGRGIQYVHIVAESDGELEAVEPPQRILLFIKKQRFRVGDRWYTVWFPPDQLLPGRTGFGGEMSGNRAGLRFGETYRKGEDIIKVAVRTGDYLFVDRITYNFRKPARGEIIVFETAGITGPAERPDLRPAANTFYIKRLIATGGERVSIGNDRHVRINGERLDAATPRFENIYHFRQPPLDSQYSGHVNQLVASQNGRGNLAYYFRDEASELQVRPGHCLAFGDNTMNSLDSRSWGDFPALNIIGKSAFVYWPVLSGRFGWSHR
jgi:signal peptidase I